MNSFSEVYSVYIGGLPMQKKGDGADLKEQQNRDPEAMCLLLLGCNI